MPPPSAARYSGGDSNGGVSQHELGVISDRSVTGNADVFCGYASGVKILKFLKKVCCHQSKLGEGYRI